MVEKGVVSHREQKAVVRQIKETAEKEAVAAKRKFGLKRPVGRMICAIQCR